MRFAMMIALAAISAASCRAALPPAFGTNANCVAVASESLVATNMTPQIAATNVIQAAGSGADVNSNVWNTASVKIVYPDVPPDDFSVEDWAEELSEDARQGLHMRNGQVLAVARIPAVEGEYQSLTKLRAKFRAIEFLRQHYPNLPEEFTAPCRILICERLEDPGQIVAVIAFSTKDLPSG